MYSGCPMIECPRSFCLVKSKVNVCEVALGQVSMMLCYVIVKNVTSTDHLGMLRIDCSGKTRLALHVPWSHELENVIITIVIIMHACDIIFVGAGCIATPLSY